jgi:hypothetical protein
VTQSSSMVLLLGDRWFGVALAAGALGFLR